MHIKKLDRSQLVDAYNIKCQGVYPWAGVVEPPFGAGWAIVEPGGFTKHHNHQECETFLVTQGRGVMRVGDERVEVEAGDVVFQPPFNAHIIENTSDSEELIFVSIYWEDTAQWAGRRESQVLAEAPPERVLVTAAPPTPNGDLHLGHLSGPYLAADILTRALKLRGVDAYFACGTDDHFSHVLTKAQQLGLSGRESADRLSGAIQESLAAADIRPDLFIGPTSQTYADFVREFFLALHESGQLVEKEASSPWCESCQLYLYEAHIRGGCPHCGSETGGYCCEDCGRPNDSNLIDPVCTHCGGHPVQKTFKRLYFPLRRYEKQLRDFYLHVGMNTHLRALLEQVLGSGLPDMAVTHPAEWGFPVPLPGWEGQVLAVWFETAPRYLAYARELLARQGNSEADWPSFWKDEKARVVQCFGCDNGFLYAMYIPALLLAFDPAIQLPAAYVMNEFYRLDDLKFSTTRRHAIWAREMLADVPSDLVRFYLAATRPETDSTNFTVTEFEETVERELIGTWQAWLQGLWAKVADERGGEVPYTGDWTEEHRRFYQRLEDLAAEIDEAYQARTFSTQRVVAALSSLVRAARRFGRGELHWRRVPARSEERRTSIALEVLAAKVLALAVAPIMPKFAERLWHDLGYDTPLSDARWEARPTWVPGGINLRSQGQPYFFLVGFARTVPEELSIAG